MNDHDSLSEARSFSLRLVELLRRENAALVDFLLALAEFEERGLHAALGYATLFDFLHRQLRLSRGAAHYRKVAARLVRRFPQVADALRDGKLCFTTVIEVERILEDGNVAEVLPRFFALGKQEAQALAAELDPKVLRQRTVVTELPELGLAAHRAPMGAAPDRPASIHPAPDEPAHVNSGTCKVHPDEREWSFTFQRAPTAPATSAPATTTVEPMTAVASRLHITVSREFLAKLRRAKAGESHRTPGATDEQVLLAALDALLEKQSKRKASVPAKVKREVMQRDGARCQWPTADGGICGATSNLQIDHVHPRAKGGPSTTDNCRVLCRAHNLEAARQAYGDDHMDRFAPRQPVAREDVGGYGPGARDSTLPDAAQGLALLPGAPRAVPAPADPAAPPGAAITRPTVNPAASSAGRAGRSAGATSRARRARTPARSASSPPRRGRGGAGRPAPSRARRGRRGCAPAPAPARPPHRRCDGPSR